jgi:hypothetical protein
MNISAPFHTASYPKRFQPMALVALLFCIGLPSASHAQTCGLAQTAFCETFESGPALLNDRGRGGELSRARFSTTRFAPALSTGSVVFWVWEAELGMLTGEPASCRSDVVGFLLPTRDTLICEPTSSIGSRYLLTAVATQNYGSNAYRIRQPFDFANRTGTITFDADISTNFLLGYLSVAITEDPSPAPAWDINGRGPNPRNGVMVVLVSNDAQVHDVRDYAATLMPGQATGMTSQRGHLARVQLRLSQQQLEVLTSDPSPDGINFSPLVSRRTVVFNTPLDFTRGYVSLLGQNHATWKYAITYAGTPRPIRSWNVYWDNIGFDGPALTSTREYEIPDANVPSTKTTIDEHPAGVFTTTVHQGLSLGYVIPDGEANMSPPLTFTGVQLANATRARLVLNGYYQGYNIDGIRLGTGRLRYQLNNHPIHVRPFTPGETAMIDMPGQTGGYNHSIDIPLSELVEGNNTVRFSTLNISSGYHNAVTNLDLLIDFDLGIVFGNSFE